MIYMSSYIGCGSSFDNSKSFMVDNTNVSLKLFYVSKRLDEKDQLRTEILLSINYKKQIHF